MFFHQCSYYYLSFLKTLVSIYLLIIDTLEILAFDCSQHYSIYVRWYIVNKVATFVHSFVITYINIVTLGIPICVTIC